MGTLIEEAAALMRESLFNQLSGFCSLNYNYSSPHAGTHDASEALQLDVFIIQSLYFHFCPHSHISLSLPPAHSPLTSMSWCVFHLMLFNEPHFTVRTLMTLIN